MFVVAGVTGHVGGVIAETLLAAERKVRVIVRSEDKGAPWRAKGAEVALASLDDDAAVARALEGAEGAFLLLPPDYASNDNIREKAEMTAALGRAITRAKVPHVVFLSSIGAQHTKGTGPIRTVHHAERELGRIATTRFTWLRPAYFVENVGSLIGAVKGQGVLPSTFDPTKRIPMIATRDIGEAGAKALLEGPAEGRAAIVELAGPRDVSFDDVAKELSALLGREIKTVRVPREAVAGALQQAGMTPDLAGLYAEMSAGVDDGTVDYEGHGARFARGRVEAKEVLRALVG
ncbi:NmrA family NAD(P)-binding protein [Sandaracinus amylolyticus]|uniref:NmrA family NAD(P)-binding protein n=1 Tax=Sandaracinus amylolyticus TaxID=927083 RepID=UPI001F15BE5A|nr:NmrA family NAD(P)-binding protein [Sandaracinus amylolyticus]UJR78725.1 NAD-dependent dehydratase [Sandaracinus amylolyticus]